MFVGDDLGPWDPLTPAAVAQRFADVTAPWWVAGGYAIELFAGRPLRTHGDIDILLLRRDQDLIHRVLVGWDIHAADPPGTLRPWPQGERLPEHVHDIWCREHADGPWRLQFMLDRDDDGDWVFRRDPRLRWPLDSLGMRNADGIPFLRPEIQLLYKSTRSSMAKNRTDFEAGLPLLTPAARRWLDDALALTEPDHPWRTALAAHD